MDKREINSKVSSDIKRSKDIASLIVSLLISGIFLYLVVAPVYRSKVEVEGLNTNKREDLRGKQELLSNIESFNKNNRDLSVDSKKLIAMIPNRNNFEDMLSYLKDRVKNHNMELLDISLEESSQKGKVPVVGASADAGMELNAGSAGPVELKEQGISLILRGSYSDFIKLIKFLENSIPFVQEDSFDIKVMEASTSSETNLDTENPQEKIQDLNPTLDFSLKLRFIHY